MKRLALIALLTLFGAVSARAQVSAVPATQVSIPIAISTITTTQLIAPPAQALQSILVTSFDVVAAGTGNIQFIAGTGATCGTGTINVTGNYVLTAQTRIGKGDGAGAVWVLPQGFGLCAVTSAAVGMAGGLSYAIY